MPGILNRLADHESEGSLATRMRRRRFKLFVRLLATVPPPVKLLDVGGTQRFWEMMSFAGAPDLRITLYNPQPQPVTGDGFRSLTGDARSMSDFLDSEFDVVFSNSVIEHVGGPEDQARMAAEVRRVGKRYFIQTPNRYFPLEPHFLFPGFQFLPVPARAFLHAHLNLGWPRASSYEKALENVSRIRLLSRGDLLRIFPDAELYEEPFWGLTKSLVAYGGWLATARIATEPEPLLAR